VADGEVDVARIWLSPPDVTGDDRQRLIDAVDGGWVAPVGPDLDGFEREVATATGRAFGVGLSSGTAALHLALLGVGVGPGDEVLTSTFTFVATANAIRYIGAQPVFIDSEPSTWQMSPDLLGEELAARKASGRALPAAVVVVDLYGQAADYGRIVPILDEYGVPLIEDAAEALGATFGDRPAGSFGAAAVVSFNGNKIISTSGGGMLVTDDEAVAVRARHLATQARQPVAHYEHTEVGFNYRLSNLLAAFGRGQLADLGRRVDRRRAINQRYRTAFAGEAAISFMPEADYGRSTNWLTCIRLDPSGPATPEEVRLHLEDHDVESRPTWKPMHQQPAYADAPARIDGTSDRIFAEGLCLPSGSTLADREQDRVIDLVRERLG
jgi:pyridoxal phosphate-dependent aminotransferase EpsN